MQIAEQQSVKTACWSCGADVSGPLCAACGKVQPATEQDYFAVFSLPRRLSLDTKVLEREFYRLSRRLHPDLYARTSELEQQWSTEQTSLVNDAYRALKDPIARTEYLLKLEGMAIGEETTGKKQQPPADLLEEVFELNMQLEEMRMGGDDPQLRSDLENAKKQFEAQLAQADADLAALWAKWDGALAEGDLTAQTASKEEMLALLDRRRYVRNLVRDVNAALDGQSGDAPTP